ncbi:hypothetical protein [uncultured Mucilaginibacter sp.]|uniref:hypothetical protein n=1 Tax=uncultured Mucilaginibacter sp. TaxID=797541 RepID=UPI0025EEF94C|nr:hypothetical protein [uncultured Mucilaginibacter sp.]
MKNVILFSFKVWLTGLILAPLLLLLLYGLSAAENSVSIPNLKVLIAIVLFNLLLTILVSASMCYLLWLLNFTHWKPAVIKGLLSLFAFITCILYARLLFHFYFLWFHDALRHKTANYGLSDYAISATNIVRVQLAWLLMAILCLWRFKFEIIDNKKPTTSHPD